MKVRCVSLINPNNNEAEENSPWLTLEKEYCVLEVYFGHDEKLLKYRLESDDNKSPTLHHAENFKVISEFVPSNWVVKNVNGQWFGLAPKSWYQDGFWVAYFDGEDWARMIYTYEVEKIIDEEKRHKLMI